jgi:hypothetical protein
MGLCTCVQAGEEWEMAKKKKTDVAVTDGKVEEHGDQWGRCETCNGTGK